MSKKLTLKAISKYHSAISILFFIGLVPVKLTGQHYYLAPAFSSKYCNSALYYGVNNKMCVKREGESNKIKNVELRSDSIAIEKINDTTYNLRPLYSRVNCRLTISKSTTMEIVGLLTVFCESDPFLFSISSRHLEHKSFPNEQIFDELRTLYMRSKNEVCDNYAKKYKIMTYELALFRKEELIMSEIYDGNSIINTSFKNKLKASAKTGDVLYARDISLKGEGQVIKIDNYALMIAN